MPKTSKRNIRVSSTSPAPAKPAPANVPANVPAKAPKQAAPKAAPLAAPVTTSVAPATQAAPVVTLPRGLARDAIGIVRNATNFDQYSDRDTAYLRFFGSVMRSHNGSATLAQIAENGVTRDGNARKRYNPHYAGSAKATDVGAINRLKKAGYISASADGLTLTATPLARTHAAYLGTIKA